MALRYNSEGYNSFRNWKLKFIALLYKFCADTANYLTNKQTEGSSSTGNLNISLCRYCKRLTRSTTYYESQKLSFSDALGRDIGEFSNSERLL